MLLITRLNRQFGRKRKTPGKENRETRPKQRRLPSVLLFQFRGPRLIRVDGGVGCIPQEAPIITRPRLYTSFVSLSPSFSLTERGRGPRLR